MHDLPSQTLLQQANARPVSGEELEVFGKAAASRFMCGDADSLNDAVVETVKQAALSPEQVRRVIEFANTAAYLQEFKKEGATHKYIHFDGGPASPTEVLKDLNDGGGGTVFDRGSADYFQPPPNTKTAAARLLESNREVLVKVAAAGFTAPLQSAKGAPPETKFWDVHGDYSKEPTGSFAQAPGKGVAVPVQMGSGQRALMRLSPEQFEGLAATYKLPLKKGDGGYDPEQSRAVIREMMVRGQQGLKKQAADPVEAAFERMFHVEEQPLPYAEPWAEAEAMREKLATTRDNLNSELSFLEGEFRDITDQLYDLVKQAAMEGVPLSHVIQSWTHVTPGPGFVKAAFSHIGPRLAQDGVMSLDGIGESLTKHAAAGTWNPEHPLPGTFAGFCSHLTKLAEVREQRDICHQEYERLDGFIKKAGSLARSVKGGLERAAGKGGLWNQLKGVTRSAGETAGGATQQVGEALLGKGSRVASGAGKVVGKGVEYAPEIGGALAAKEMYDQVKYRPSFQMAKNVVQSRIPYTHPYMVREYQLQQNAGGMF